MCCIEGQPPGHGDVPGASVLPELGSHAQAPEGARANLPLLGQLFSEPSLLCALLQTWQST